MNDCSSLTDEELLDEFEAHYVLIGAHMRGRISCECENEYTRKLRAELLRRLAGQKGGKK